MGFKLKYIFTVMFFFLLIGNVHAVDILKPAKINQSYIILQTCASCTFVNVTVSNVNGIIVANEPMINNGSGVWTFNLTPQTISRHDVTGAGDLDGTLTSFATFFDVTPSGKVSETGDSILYALFSLILFGIIFAISFFIFTMPNKNELDPAGGFETKVLRIKYLRIVFIALIYPLIILLLNFLNGLAVNFSALTMFAGMLGFLFDILMRLSFPFMIIIITWIIVSLVHDSNVNKQIKRFGNIGIPR